jgi:hypothetical protein
MIVGADENAIVTQPRIDVASQQTGHSIEFWGRYFKNPGNTSPEQYQPNKEAALLNEKNIRVLPIGRQTGHVAGSESLGRADGTTNAKAIIGAFGTQVLSALPHGLVVFLDVEGPPNPSLSVDYYKGWADGLAQTAQAAGVKLLPAVYGPQGDSATWTHLAQAVSNGAACEGTWIARPGTLGSRSWHGRPCWNATISTSASSIRHSRPRRWASSCCRRCHSRQRLPPSRNRGPRPKCEKSEPRNRRRGAPRGKSAPRSRKRSEPRGKRDRERNGARP